MRERNLVLEPVQVERRQVPLQFLPGVGDDEFLGLGVRPAVRCQDLVDLLRLGLHLAGGLVVAPPGGHGQAEHRQQAGDPQPYLLSMREKEAFVVVLLELVEQVVHGQISGTGGLR